MCKTPTHSVVFPKYTALPKMAIRHAASVLLTEINSVTDNPTIFPDEDLIISGGNFHGQPLALVYDYLAIALAELGNISERRVAQLIMGTSRTARIPCCQSRTEFRLYDSPICSSLYGKPK